MATDHHAVSLKVKSVLDCCGTADKEAGADASQQNSTTAGSDIDCSGDEGDSSGEVLLPHHML